MTTVNTQQVSNELLATMNGTSSTSTSAQTSTDEATNRFMTLLVTQLKNQDPLNPMDNAELTSQLAQLSTVTGINQLNTTVDSLLGSLQSSQSYQASGLVGHNVLVDGNSLTLKDGAGYFGIDLPVGANNVTVTIKDSSGTPVKSITMGKQDEGTLPLVWDGTTDSGTTAANGKYTFDVSATISNTSVTATGLSYQSVLSVSNTTSGVKLNLSDNSSVSTDSVKEIF
ncbi:flagellar hook assembly protein FlgD [Methyloradius palustris]|uniref:Basal-body rod modification protein FlgD n=1 Tax=Methyloradius palustris TaxID=2778876 RepID=A0A8D5G096_9PROT|nr:flagellar hook assembly protein FlgD [Methyloradius palustris]BCM25457.1 basal-body rod modification protein FlgD [Methyloradius palustris]